MKQRFLDMPFHRKLFYCNLAIVLIVVVLLSVTMLLTGSRQAISSNEASLNLLSEQVLINTDNEAETARQHLYSMSVATAALSRVREMQSMDEADSEYRQTRSQLALALSRMVDSGAPYDSVSMLLTNGDYVCGNYSSAVYNKAAQALLSLPENAENQHGATRWVRDEKGRLFLIRDFYLLNPLRYGGKIAAHIRDDRLLDLGKYNETFHCTLLVLNQNRELAFALGDRLPGGAEEAAASYLASPTPLIRSGGDSYSACLFERNGWSVVGLLPSAVTRRVQNSIVSNCIIVAVLGILLGAFVSGCISRHLTQKLENLVTSMNQVGKGGWDATIQVDSRDEIGIVSSRFNEMIGQIKELLGRLVEETAAKERAEYQNLEYEYRFLQWQINPHFIYNTLETINGLAKLNDDEETSEMIMLLSDYFRQNAESMRNRFATIHREFNSLRQYADIYRYLCGKKLDVAFRMSENAKNAYVPTMIVQPLLENALIHGMNIGRETHVEISADTEAQRLIVRIKDNGQGMPKTTLEKILEQGAAENAPHTSLGIRNVINRMKLIYGEACGIVIDSREGEGTCIALTFPLQYQSAVQG